MSESTQALQNWFNRLDRRVSALIIGGLIGGLAGLIGLSVAILTPQLTIALILGIMLGLYILTDVRVALYGVIGFMLLLPFGTLPFRIGFTPTFLDVALLAFLLVYLVQWMTGRRSGFRFAIPQVLIGLYVLWLIFAWVLGFQYGNPTSTDLRRFMAMLLAIGLTVILVDLIREKLAIRRLMQVLILTIGAQAVIALGLFILNDFTAENLLVRLARLGYPNGGVIRYIEDNPALGERAIGTWVDPNALGGIMAVSAILIASQIFAKTPVFRQRWLLWSIFGATALALYLTNSRASFLALAVGVFVMVWVRYRHYLPYLMFVGTLFLFLPQTQNYIDRILQAFQGEDLSTQMRIGEWTDAMELIQRFPLTGIGFTGTPYRNVYTDVANMYLIMANQIGITGVIFFLIAMGGVFVYGYQAWKVQRNDPHMESIHLGLHLALMTALINAIADLYYFRLDFQSSITWFWMLVALCIISSRMTKQDSV
jgi:polysaccharide biosynthesis protein PslJ